MRSRFSSNADQSRRKRGGGGGMFGADDVGHHPRQRAADVDRRIDALLGKRAREDDMAVDDRAGGVDDRVLIVVAVGEHRVERGDRAAGDRVGAGALDQLRE